jgi:hypothetical protein
VPDRSGTLVETNVHCTGELSLVCFVVVVWRVLARGTTFLAIYSSF